MDDQFDGDVIPHLQCDVEMQLTGPNYATIPKWAADVLRRVTDSRERNEFKDSGFFDLNDNIGKKVGTIYLNYEEEGIDPRLI